MNRSKFDVLKFFDIRGRTAIITGGAGLLGVKHGEAIASAGGIPILVDIEEQRVFDEARHIGERFGVNALGINIDITEKKNWDYIINTVLDRFGRVDILVNNAAKNPKVKKDPSKNFTRVENFPIEHWETDFAVGVTGAFLGCQAAGKVMLKQGKGVIVNIGSDFSVIAPDQRVYQQEGLPEEQQNVKPVSYSVIKHAIIGLTKYLAIYWAKKGIRVNALSPGGVYENQPGEFVAKVEDLIPVGCMAKPDQYQAALLFLCSDASSHMTGQNLIIDGGRSVW